MLVLDEKLDTSSIKIIEWSLCEVRLKNNRYFPWILLIPRVPSTTTEIFQLHSSEQAVLMNEISRASQLLQHFFNADKINTGTLGNIVSQLHIHIVARFKEDLLWPHSVWQSDLPEKPYHHTALEKLIPQLHDLFS